MSADRIVLFTDSLWISPWVMTCFVALHEKTLPFETSLIALDRNEQRAPEYASKTLTARVPAIALADFWLAESTAIVEYLEEMFPPPKHAAVLPRDVRDRARARQLLAWIRSDLAALREDRPTTTLFYERAKTPLSVEGRAAADKLVHVATQVVRDPAGSIFGEWSVVDTDLALMLERLVMNGDPVPEPLRAYAAAQWARPSVRAFVERERPPAP